MLNAALAYAARGWAVFPVMPPRLGQERTGKLPLYPNPHPKDSAQRRSCRGECGQRGHGLYDATTDPDTITTWWTANPTANIGLPAGANGLAVVDVDPRYGGTDTLTRLEETVGLLPGTITQVTGGDGCHLVYAHPGGRLPSRAEAFGDDMPGLDVKADGGYVVAAPSRHYTGGRYQWIGDDFTSDPTPWPAHLTAIIEPPPARRKPRVVRTPTRRGYGQAALRGEIERVAGAAHGGRNHTLNRAAFSLGQLVAAGHLDHDVVIRGLLDAANACGLLGDDGMRCVLGTIESGLSGGARAPRREVAA